MARFGVKNVDKNGRLQIKHVCDRLKIEYLDSIANPDEDSIKHHPHVQYDCGLVDSFRDIPTRFVSLDGFINLLEKQVKLRSSYSVQ